MSKIEEYRSRTLDQEPDTAVIIPQHPDFIVIGTYHLNTTTEDEKGDTSSQPKRGGSIQIISLSTGQEDERVLSLARKDFPWAVVDLQFHPSDDTLLGAATSIGEVRLFRILKHDASDNEYPDFDIVEIGVCKVSGADEFDTSTLVTYLTWLPGTTNIQQDSTDQSIAVTLATCDTKGETKIIRITLPTLGDQSGLVEDTECRLSCEIEVIHRQQHDLEAWFTAFIQPQQTDDEKLSCTILSGGDDANIFISQCEYATEGGLELISPSSKIRVRNQHDAGVVSILPLGVFQHDCIPILTGSYDDNIRLFRFKPSAAHQGLELVSSLNLGGGVWRIIPLDLYVLESETMHWTFLVCTMYAGATIVRLTALPDKIIAGHTWTISVEAVFTAGHKSMVYAAVARPKSHSMWHIVTTSFYDRKICEWQWEDTLKPR